MTARVLIVLSIFIAQAHADRGDGFPLAVGNTWTYRATVQRDAFDSECYRGGACDGKGATYHFTWKMEIVDVQRRGDLTVARLKGHPYDLLWYQPPGPKRGDYLLVQSDAGKVYLLGGLEYEVVQIPGWLDDEAALRAALGNDRMLLDLPLTRAKVYGCILPDRCWQVVEVKPALLAFAAAADHMEFTFVPNVGVKRIDYNHNGTLYRAHITLTEFHRGR